jgi:hypothetical protein
LKAIGSIAGPDCLKVRLAAVDHNPLGSAMPLKGSAQEPLGGSQIALLAEPELDRVAVAVDYAIQVHPSTTDFGVSFVHMPLPANGPLAPVELLAA